MSERGSTYERGSTRSSNATQHGRARSGSATPVLDSFTSCVSSLFVDEDSHSGADNVRGQEEERQVRQVYEEGLRLKRKSRELQALLADTEERRQLDRQEFDSILRQRDAQLENLRGKHALDIQEVLDSKNADFHDILRQLLEARTAQQRITQEADELKKWVRTMESDASQQQAFFQQTMQEMAETHSCEIRDISAHVGKEMIEERDQLLVRAMAAEAELARLASNMREKEQQQQQQRGGSLTGSAARVGILCRAGSVPSKSQSQSVSSPLSPLSGTSSPFGSPSFRMHSDEDDNVNVEQAVQALPEETTQSALTLAELATSRQEVSDLQGTIAAKNDEIATLYDKLTVEQSHASSLAQQAESLQCRITELVTSRKNVENAVAQVREENDRLHMHIRVLAESKARTRATAPGAPFSQAPAPAPPHPPVTGASTASSMFAQLSWSGLGSVQKVGTSAKSSSSSSSSSGSIGGSEEPSPLDTLGPPTPHPPMHHPPMLSPLRTRPATLCTASPQAVTSAGIHGISTTPPAPVSGGTFGRAPGLNNRGGPGRFRPPS